MNAICPYCGEAQHYSVTWMDTVVPCGSGGREFLLCNKPRDEIPSQQVMPKTIRKPLHIFFWILFIVSALGLPLACLR